jgi:methyl-accepting chemotaxis protein
MGIRIRKRLLIDRKVQGALMLRAVEYWFCCVLTVGLALLAWNLLTGPDESLHGYFVEALHYFLVAGVVSLLVLPALVYDALRLSNKFTGPLFRLRRELRRLAAGERVSPIHFRTQDFWSDLADEFNATSDRMEMLSKLAEDGRKTDGSKTRSLEDTWPVGGPSEQPRGEAEKALPRTGANELDQLDLPEQLFDLPRNAR